MRPLISTILLLEILCVYIVQALANPIQLVAAEDINQLAGFVYDAQTMSDLSPQIQKYWDDDLVQYDNNSRIDEIKDVMMEIKLNDALCPLICQVVRQEASPLPTLMTINKGTADGVKIGMAVVYRSALVGKVIQAEMHAALVQTILHPEFAIQCLVRSETADSPEKSASGNAEVLLYDRSNRPYLRMVVTDDGPAQIGDIVLTFGNTWVVNGIILGTVTSITENDVHRCITIIPAIDFAWLPCVIVLRYPTSL